MTRVSDCNAVRDAFKKGQSLATPELRAHVDTCAPCTELVADEARLGQRLAEAQAPQDDVDWNAQLARLQKSVAQERGARAWLRSRPTPIRLVLAAGTAALLLMLVVAFSRRADLGVYPLLRLSATLAIYTLLAGMLLRSALVRLQQPWPVAASRWPLLALAVALPFVAASLPVAHALHPASLEGAGADFTRRAVACFTYGGVVALPVVLLTIGLARTRIVGDVLAPVVGVSAALVGMAALELHCPITHPVHLLVGHATVGLVWFSVWFGLSRLLRRPVALR